MPARDAYLYAAGLGLCGLIITIFSTPFSYMRNVYGMRVRVACTSLVYSKVGVLKHSLYLLYDRDT
jgi:ATP-binding cassette subfamily C (CFTR/MRP) protein 4